MASSDTPSLCWRTTYGGYAGSEVAGCAGSSPLRDLLFFLTDGSVGAVPACSAPAVTPTALASFAGAFFRGGMWLRKCAAASSCGSSALGVGRTAASALAAGCPALASSFAISSSKYVFRFGSLFPTFCFCKPASSLVSSGLNIPHPIPFCLLRLVAQQFRQPLFAALQHL